MIPEGVAPPTRVSPAMGEKPGRVRVRGRKEDAWQGMALHTTRKRAKVYRLENNGKWDDQGTGHVTIDYVEGSRELVLAVVDEEDNDTLLLHNITPEDIYRKQEDELACYPFLKAISFPNTTVLPISVAETIISWRDPEKALELALSFQEPEGCSYIWENMSHEAGPKPALKCQVASRGSLLHVKPLSSVNGELKELPPLELSSLDKEVEDSFNTDRPIPASTGTGMATRSPLDDEDLLTEILLRLPPLPSSLPRASLVCKRWRCIISDRRFLRRFRAHQHWRPPLFGLFFHRRKGVRFVPMLEPPDRIPAARFCLPHSHEDGWFFCGCHCGLTLMYNVSHRQAVVWEPLTGHQCIVAFPPGFDHIGNAAVLCASKEKGHIHGDCHSSTFKVVLVSTTCTHAVACIYSSESTVWCNLISTAIADRGGLCLIKPSTLVGNALYWLLSGGSILECNFESQNLVEIEKPTDAKCQGYDYSHIQVLGTKEGVLGLAILVGLTLHIWDMKSNPHGSLGWVLQKVLQLDKVLLLEPAVDEECIVIWGYSEDNNLMFICAHPDSFMIQLDTLQVNALAHNFSIRRYYPYSSFFAAESRPGVNV